MLDPPARSTPAVSAIRSGIELITTLKQSRSLFHRRGMAGGSMLVDTRAELTGFEKATIAVFRLGKGWQFAR
jgi:hypothetical protein